MDHAATDLARWPIVYLTVPASKPWTGLDIPLALILLRRQIPGWSRDSQDEGIVFIGYAVPLLHTRSKLFPSRRTVGRIEIQKNYLVDPDQRSVKRSVLFSNVDWVS